MVKFIKIYLWQFISLAVSFASVFVVTPFISSNQELFGIYSIVIAAFLFLSYADFGFLGAGMKYAAESYAKKDLNEEISYLGFSGALFMFFGCLFALGILFLAKDPTILISDLQGQYEIGVASKLLYVLAAACPILVIQRIIQIVFAIRLEDYKFQRVLVFTNAIKILSVFVFFSKGKYLLVEYFIFVQCCTMTAVVVGLMMLGKFYKYPLLTFFKSFRFRKEIYIKTKNLAFNSIFLTISWILYYELDSFALAKLLGAKEVAIYAIGLAIITYFRAVFGIIYTPFIAKFNHYVGLKNDKHLQQLFFHVLELYLPITAFSVVIIALTSNHFVLSWVGVEYVESIPIAKVLVGSYVFSFITYPSGVILVAKERVKLLYVSGVIQPLIFWAGIVSTIGLLGLMSFAYFKFIAFLFQAVFYLIALQKVFDVNMAKHLFRILKPFIVPLLVVLASVYLIKPFMPSTMGISNLFLYFAYAAIPFSLGLGVYYFSSIVFRDYTKRVINAFNSIEFLIFLPIVFIIYWFVLGKNLRGQNLLLLIASYFFYGWWDWQFLTLILLSTIVDFICGQKITSTINKAKKKLFLRISIFTNLGILGFFKYSNFFVESFIDAFTLFGLELSSSSLAIVLPVGISFYTFQTMSYTIDLYKGKMDQAKGFVDFAAFVSFFPQLVAGPIERASNLLPQFYQKRNFDIEKAKNGMRQILWGLLKKVVIADNCATIVNEIFNNSDQYSGSTLVLGAVLFAFQVYGDFSGYSDIAIGVSRLFGFNLMQNFAFPYFSRDIAEFWRRWHISLSTWFRDYLYIPLGGSRTGMRGKIRNTFIIFLVSGFWHGANWTFVAWGLNALYFLPLLIAGKNRSNIEVIAKGKIFPGFKDLVNVLLTFSLTVLAWIFFRAESMSSAIDYLEEIFSISLFKVPEVFPKITLVLILVFLVIEWLGREGKFAIEKFGLDWHRVIRWVFYYVLCFCILWFSGPKQDFIYFQF